MPSTNNADLILMSNSIFTAAGDAPIAGFVAVADGKILAAGPGDGAAYRGDNTEVRNLGDNTICPGFVDAHCFFTGYAMESVRADPDDITSVERILRDRDFIIPMFRKYMAMMNARGITAVKEMGFDDFHGFADILAELEQAGELTLRVTFMSQPVGRGMDLAHGRAMRERFKGDFLRFSGYNRMTDGSISRHEGDLKEPYADKPDLYCAQDIDYAAIEREVLAADAEGFRFSLHAQGDAAVARVLDIYEKCARDGNGRLVNRHAVTDLELSDPEDLKRMGRLGAMAEIYPQIPSLYERAEKVALTRERVGDRGKYYWNRRAMADSGVPISCATDLPLLIDDIPESIYHACGGRFADGGEPFNPENTLTTAELLRAWSHGGAYNLSLEDRIGTLEAGKFADIVVFTADIFATPLQRMREVSVQHVFVNGTEVRHSGRS